MIQFNIGNFFDKFKNTALKEMRIRQTIADSIEKNAGVKIDLKEISLKDKIIRINASPAAKNHIFMKKEAILASVKNDLPGFIVSDLR